MTFKLTFKLIDKEKDIVYNLLWEKGFKTEDIKEFIRLLKEDLFGGAKRLSDNEMIGIIDKRTGFSDSTDLEVVNGTVKEFEGEE